MDAETIAVMSETMAETINQFVKKSQAVRDQEAVKVKEAVI